jgi:hypothetical protein
MSSEWTPDTLKQYIDVQFNSLQDQIDRRFTGLDRQLAARDERSEGRYELVSLHLQKQDQAIADLQGGQRASNRLWTLMVAGVAAIAAIITVVILTLPHK